MNDWKNIFIWLFILIALANAFLIGRRVGKQGQEEVIRTQVDTLVIRDTIRINEPVIVERRVVDTMTIEVPD
jgi:hypothetical protein